MKPLAVGLIYSEQPGEDPRFRKDLRLVLMDRFGGVALVLEVAGESAWTAEDSEGLMRLLGKLYPGFFWSRVKGSPLSDSPT